MPTAERVILIQGDADKWYEQAIFIVRPGTSALPKNMVMEAEHIIAAYLKKNNKPLPAKFPAARGYAPPPPAVTAAVPPVVPVAKKAVKHEKSTGFFLNILMVLACLAMAGVFLYGMFM